MTKTVHPPGELVVQEAIGSLADRLPELTDRLVAQLSRGEEDADEAFWETTRAGLSSVLEAVVTRGRERPDLSYARRLGRRYAERRIPLAAALRMYRLTGSVLWDGMVDVVSERDPERLPELVTGTRLTWQMIDQLSTVAAESYQETQRRLLGADTGRAHRVLDDLLDGRPADGDVVRSAAAVLDLPEDGRYVVVAIDSPGVANLAPEGGMSAVWRLRDGVRLGIVHLGAESLDTLARTLAPPAGARAGIGLPVTGLGDLGRARRLAELALCACPDDAAGPVRLDERMPEALAAEQPELACLLRDKVLGRLPAEGEERTVLLDTVEVWFDSAGSTAEAARRLGCHRNTVLNRLRRFEDVTGRRLSHPRAVTEVALALAAVRLRLSPP